MDIQIPYVQDIQYQDSSHAQAVLGVGGCLAARAVSTWIDGRARDRRWNSGKGIYSTLRREGERYCCGLTGCVEMDVEEQGKD
jgi:hypothetical protein